MKDKKKEAASLACWVHRRGPWRCLVVTAAWCEAVNDCIQPGNLTLRILDLLLQVLDFRSSRYLCAIFLHGFLIWLFKLTYCCLRHCSVHADIVVVNRVNYVVL